MVSTFNRLAPLGVVTFWLALMVGVYFGFNHFMKPKPQVITSTGDLVFSTVGNEAITTGGVSVRKFV
ncbi:MAG: hypothetical protein QM533_08360 [Cytophagales bacterium]|nr:hypothetical protein [Cytophagales bacterium]